jgi:hypothetical protein
LKCICRTEFLPFSGDLAKGVSAAVGKADPHNAKERNIMLVRAEVVAKFLLMALGRGRLRASWVFKQVAEKTLDLERHGRSAVCM